MNLVTIILSPYYAATAMCGGVVWAFKGSYRFVKAVKKWEQGRKPTHGDAELAPLKLLKKEGYLQPVGWYVGVKDGKPLYTPPEASGLAIAPKGEGKSYLGIAQLRDLAARSIKDDVVVVDPAGDIHAATVQQFRDAGYNVIVVDAVNARTSAKYDPLTVIRTLDEDNLDRDVDQLCTLLMPDDAKSDQPHFQEFARILLSGLIVYMLENDPANATLFNVVELLSTNVARRNATFSLMRLSANAKVRQAVSAFDEAGDKEKGSFSTTMARKLNIWLRPAIRRLTEYELNEDGLRPRGWTWENIYTGDIPTVVYIMCGLGTGEGALARLFLGNAINTRRYMWNALRKPFNRRLRLFVDEALEIGNCTAIMDANNTLRKAGVTTMMYWLTSRDVFQTYPDAVTLVQNSDLYIFGGSKEKSWSEDISWLTGDKTIENPSQSEGDHGSSQSLSEQAQRVLKSDQVRRLGKREMLYVNARLSTVVVRPDVKL